MKRAAALILIFITLIVPLCGCADAREINTWAHAYIIGVDKGVTDKLRFTILLPTLRQGGQGAGGSGETQQKMQSGANITVVSIDCPTLFSGLNLMDSFLSRTVNYTHAEFFVVGEELARQGVAHFMEDMRVTREIRLDMNVIVAKGEASKLIESFDPAFVESVPEVLEGLMSTAEKTGLIDSETYMEVLKALKSDSRQATCTLGAVSDFFNYLPAGSEAEQTSVAELTAGELARKGGNPVELLGTAVFRGDKLVGELDIKETRSLLIIKGEFNSGAVTIPDPMDGESNITTKLEMHSTPDITVSLEDEVPVIDIKVKAEGTIQSQQSQYRYHTEEIKPVLEKAYAEFIASGIGDVIKKCQGLDCDVFGFGQKAASNFWTIPEWENYDWKEKFKEARVNIEVSVNILRTGIIIEHNPIERGE